MCVCERVCERVCVSSDLQHQFSVLGVDAGDGSDLFTAVQHLVELRVLQHHQIFIRHEHLEGVNASLRHQHLHLPAHLQYNKIRFGRLFK